MTVIKKFVLWLAHIKIVKKIHLSLLSFAAKSGFLSDVWYVFSGKFRREHKAVLLGRLLHKVSLNAQNSSGAVYTLRRNTHRIEKGLIMKPRRSSFALAFINQTVAMYASLISDDTARADNKKTLNWSHDCLLYTSPSPRDQRGSRMPSSA